MTLFYLFSYTYWFTWYFISLSSSIWAIAGIDSVSEDFARILSGNMLASSTTRRSLFVVWTWLLGGYTRDRIGAGHTSMVSNIARQQVTVAKQLVTKEVMQYGAFW